MASGTITSADNGTRVATFSPGKEFFVTILNGTTIAAELQVYIGETWTKVPDSNGLSDITGNYMHRVDGRGGEMFGLYVTTATGIWNYEINTDKN